MVLRRYCKEYVTKHGHKLTLIETPTQDDTVASNQPDSNRPLDYDRLEILLVQMAALVETNLGDAITAVERRDVALAEKLIAMDARIDRLHVSLEMDAYKLLEKNILNSEQLRGVLAMIRMATDLERVGDLAKNIARRVCIIAREKLVPHNAGLIRMGGVSLRQFSDVLNAYISRDLEAAVAVWAGDDEVDQLYQSVFREILVGMQEDTARVNSSTHMVFIAKNFERVADHATNIAEALHFLMTGHPFEDPDLANGR